MTARAGKIRLVKAVQHAPAEQSAIRQIQSEAEPELQSMLDPQESEAFSRAVLKYVAHASVGRNKLTKDDWFGALACFWLVFVSCLPAAVPFLFFSKPHTALRVSNLLLLALLFLVGRKWAQYTGMKPLAAGAAMVGIGLALVGVAVLLGG